MIPHEYYRELVSHVLKPAGYQSHTSISLTLPMKSVNNVRIYGGLSTNTREKKICHSGKK